MIALAILPPIALGALAAVAAGLFLGSPAAIEVLRSYTYILAPASLCVFFTVWRGAGKQASFLAYVTLFGFLMTPLWLQPIFNMSIPFPAPFTLGGRMAATCVLLAFLLTRCVITRGSRAYHAQPGPFRNLPWTSGQ
jgi:hypothetical protein